MTQVERIRQLCARLLRAENPEVIDLVADELKDAIDQYVESAKRQNPLGSFISLPAESPA